MAFMGRTARMRVFEFQDNLPVGEHEQFFYANRYFGLQAAVCFDSTFPHFRVKMTDKYRARRERMQELMTQEFQKIAHPSMLYLLTKYDHLSAKDHSEFISKEVPPWQISHDTCGPLPDPPTDFCMFFALIFSTADENGLQYRHLLRKLQSAWLQRLRSISTTRWAFMVPDSAASLPAVMEEDEENGDIIYIPTAPGENGLGLDGNPTAAQLRFALTFMRNFQLRWLIVARQEAFVSTEDFISALVQIEQNELEVGQAVVGGWRQETSMLGQNQVTEERLQTAFFGVSQDVLHLLASPGVSRWLRVDDFDAPGGGGFQEAMNAWLDAFTLRRGGLPGVYTGRSGGQCPYDASVLHPVSVEEMHKLSEAALKGQACQVLADQRGR